MMTLENALTMLELNPKNVVGVLLQCKATPETKKVINSKFYILTNQQTESYPLDKDKLRQYRPLIQYWLGQLQFVQQKAETVSPAMGLVNYQGKRWTEDTRALLALYFLAYGCSFLPSFVDKKMSVFGIYYVELPATCSPYDSKFQITKSVESALFCLGCFDTQKETIAAAKQGNANAQCKLANMLQQWAYPAYETQAKAWYEKAAKQGNTDAMWELWCYFKNEEMLNKAAKLGHTQAKIQVESGIKNGIVL